MNGDLHHPHPSQTDGTYDGRYLFANDKANTRACRIRLDVMKCDKIIQLPNQHTVHGLRVQKYPRTGYVFANGEDGVPLPNDGKILDDPAVLVDLHGGRRRHDGSRLADQGRRKSRQRRCRLSGQVLLRHLLQLGGGVTLADMMAADEDWLVVFNIHRIEEAVQSGKAEIMNGVPRLDGTHGSLYTRYIPVANGPHGINTAPDGIHIVANGKLADRDGLRRAALRRPLRGQDRAARHRRRRAGARLGPLHTAYDGRGNAYTTLFIDSRLQVEHRRRQARLPR